jgi:hypothetical protein
VCIRVGAQRAAEKDPAVVWAPSFLGADGGAQGVGQGLREALDVSIVFGFDHDAGELFGAGIAEDHAAIFAEDGLRFGEGAGNFGKSFQWGLGFHFHVDDDLRVVLEALDQGFDFAVHGDERGDFNGGEKAVAGGAVFEKNDVAGLLAADDVAAAKHFFKHVAIADGSAGERNAFAGQDTFEAEIGHGCGHDAIAVELVLGFKMTCDSQENAVAVNNLSRFADKEGAVGIAVEGHAELGALGEHAFLQTIEMERTASGVDVAAIGRNTHGDNPRAERAKKFGAKFVGGAVGAVEEDAESGKPGAGNDATAKKIEILGVERGIGGEQSWIFRRGIAAMLEDVCFERFLDGVRELHALVGKEFYAVVVVRIVRGGDNHSRLKIILAHETSNAGSGDYAGKGDGGAGLREAGGEERGDVRAGFAGVHAHEHVRGGMFPKQVGGESAAGGEESSVVERRSAGNAANTVGSEKFFGHRELAVNS